MSRNVLTMEGLHTSFVTRDRRTDVIRGIDLSVDEGKILGIVGESGSGKSVTAYSIVRLLGSSAVIDGKLTLCGEDISRPTRRELRAIRHKVGIIFQDPMTSLNPVFSIGAQLRDSMTGMHMTRKQKNARAAEMLELVGIPEPRARMRQYPHELSGGQRQRVMIAMALASSPKLLIADEPTTALDVTVQAQILELIKSLSKRLDMAVMLITHDLGVIAEMCDEVAVLYAGRICERGSLDDIFYNPKHAYTKGLLRAVPSTTGEGRLMPIAGTAANITHLPAGCAFCPRCDEAMRICLTEQPEELDFGNGHYASCWMNVCKEGADHV